MAVKNGFKYGLKFIVANIPIYGSAVLLWALLEALMNTDSFVSQLEQSLSIWLIIISSVCMLMLYIKSFEACYNKCCTIIKKFFARTATNETSKKHEQTLKGRTAKLEGLTQKKAFVRQTITPFIHADISRRQQAGQKLTRLSNSKIVEFIRSNYEQMPAELQACFVKIVSPEFQQEENVYSKEVYDEYKKILEYIRLDRKPL